MINFDDVVKENMKERNSNWPQIHVHPYIILITGTSESGKTNSLFNQIKFIYLLKMHMKQNNNFWLTKKKVQVYRILMILKRIEYSNNMVDIYKILIVFDDIIADMLSIKKLKPLVTEFFIRGRKLNIYFLFITQSYFVVPKDIRLNSMHYFIMEIPNKRELEHIASHSSSDIDLNDFMNLYTKCTSKPYSFLAIHATLASDNL